MASSAMSDRSTRSGVKERWSARLRRSSASVRSIARALTACRRSTSSPGSRVGSLRATLEEGLRDRQRRTQLVGGVGREPLLLGDLGLEPREHRVEAVGELAELVLAALQLDPVGERPGRRLAGGVGDAGQGSEHPSGEEPPADEAEEQQERQRLGRPRREGIQQVGAGRAERAGAEARAVGHVAQEEHPHGREQQPAGDHEEAGVAERELEANAQPRCPIHGLLRRVRRPAGCRCGSRRRARWR